jgi:tRNA pseudouridine synthase 10
LGNYRDSIVDDAMRLLEEMPLCDRCLGRLFALLGYGWTNKERGDAIKRVIIMEIHRKLRSGAGLSERDRRILVNIGSQALPLLRLLAEEGKDVDVEAASTKCAICGGRLDKVIEDAAERGVRLLKAFDVKRFVVGAKVDERVRRIEEEVKLKYNLAYGENIKAEIRREVGKRIQRLYPEAHVDFEEPEAVILVTFPEGSVDIQVNSLLLKGRYWKTGRLISQAYWPSPLGPRYFSVETAAWGLLKVTGGERVVVHAAGREDVDARMLGTGRPLIIEIKAPRRRHLALEELEKAANSQGKGVVFFVLEGFARRREIRLYKEESMKLRKTYKALIVSLADAISNSDLERLEREFNNRVILQRTPRRVLHRRPDIVRSKTVYRVSCRAITDFAAECLILAEGGLYIKELVDGDAGRTQPSFAEVLSKELQCRELDVIAVETPFMAEAVGRHDSVEDQG